jgi:4-hydroxy-tetrahydrodipicolinate reductase
MREPIGVLLIGLGVIGREAVHAVLGRAGLRLVGAVDADPSKAGRDLGEILGLPRALGLPVLGDLRDALAHHRADIAVHCVNTLLDEAMEQLEPLVAAGVDTVSVNEQLGNAYASNPERASRLDRAAREAGVTILGTGTTPGFTSDYLILALTAACRDVRHIRYRRTSDLRPYLGGIVGRHFGLGLPQPEFDRSVARGEILGHVGFIESAHTMAAKLGWRFDTLERKVEPRYDAAGRFLATVTAVRGIVGGTERLALEMVGSVEEKAERSDHIEIDATPPIDLTIRPQVPSVPVTANAAVNAIPHVINAAPGLMTPGDLPLVHALDGDARLLLR